MPLSTLSKEGGQAPAGTTKVKRICTRELIEKAAAGRGDEMSRVSDTVGTGQAVPEVMRRRLKSSDLMRAAVTAGQKEVAKAAAPGGVRLVSGGVTSSPHGTQAISSPLTAAPARGIGALVPAAKPSPALRPSPLASDLQVTPGVKNANISHLLAVYNSPGANSPVDTAATADPSQGVAAAPPSKLFPTAAGVRGQPKNTFVGGGYGVGSATIAPSPLALTSVVCQKFGFFQPGETGLVVSCSAVQPAPGSHTTLLKTGVLVSLSDLKAVKHAQRDGSNNWNTAWAFTGGHDETTLGTTTIDITSRAARTVVPSFVCHGLCNCKFGDCLSALESADVLQWRQNMIGRASSTAASRPGIPLSGLLARVVESDLRLGYDRTTETWSTVFAALDGHTSIEMCPAAYALLSGLTGSNWKRVRASITSGRDAEQALIVVPSAPLDERARKKQFSIDWSLLSGYVRSLLSKGEANPAPGAASQAGQVVLNTQSWKVKWAACQKSFRGADGAGSVPGSDKMLQRVWRWEKHLKEKKACSHSKCSVCSMISQRLSAIFGMKCRAAMQERENLLRAQELHEGLHLGRRYELDDAGYMSVTDPRKMWCLIADAATQANFLLPRFLRRKPKDLVGKPFWGYKLSAVFCYGYGFIPFLTHKSQKAGPNLVWTTMWISLCRMRDHYGFWPETLHITLDNTTGENKTEVMLYFSAWLVRSGKVKVVRVLFLMVGHTHIVIDQIFGLVTIGLRREDLLLPSELADNIDQTMAGLPQYMAHKVTFLSSVWDFKGWSQTMDPYPLKRLFKAEIDDEHGAYDGMYDFLFRSSGTDVRLQYREEVTDPWRPEGQGALLIKQLPEAPPELQEVNAFSVWGMEGTHTISSTMNLCYSLFGPGTTCSLGNNKAGCKTFSKQVLDQWQIEIGAIPATVSLLPDKNKLKFQHFNNFDLPRLAAPSVEVETCDTEDAGTTSFEDWMKTAGINIRTAPFSIDPVISSEQSEPEFQARKMLMLQTTFQASVPSIKRESRVYSGQFFLADFGEGGVNLFKVVKLGKMHSPDTLDLQCYAQKFIHTPNTACSGLFGSFSAATSTIVEGNNNCSRRWVGRSQIKVFNAHLTTLASKRKVLTLETLRLLGLVCPDTYPFPKTDDIPDSHVAMWATEDPT